MKTVGIVGGIGPESTIDYYRSILAECRERRPDGGAPSIVITSIDVWKALAMLDAGDLTALLAYLRPELARLSRAGADFAILAANTAHVVFDELQRDAPLPLVSIVEAAADAVQRDGLRKVALLGTRFTMAGTFYRDVFARRDLQIVSPSESDQAFIHSIYVNELLKNVFLPETREGILRIVDVLRQTEGIDGVVLGGTELPLLLRQEHHGGVKFFDTTRIHVTRIVTELLA